MRMDFSINACMGITRRTSLLTSLLASLLTFSLVASCSSSGDNCCPPVEPGQPGLPVEGPLPIDVLEQGVSSGVTESLSTCIHSEERWRAFWDRHVNQYLPKPALPPVDFSTDMVVVVTLGTRPTAGYGLEISALSLGGEVLVVESLETKPAPGSLQAQMLTTPYVILRTARFEGPVEFRLR
ncbi:MAG: hypothetical protein ACI82F_003209 [Planctomycetota bacterium]